jgi:tRNA dimethylallyltransferase
MDARTAGSSNLVVIVGETASGKSTLALQLAERFDGEIICADALTVRQGVNIGTAKPSAADRVRLPHHLLDIVEPCADFTAAVFKDLALKAIADISARGKLPIMVGGTGLYVDGVLYDYSFLPAGDRKERLALNQMSLAELQRTVSERGLNTADVDTQNKRRLIRVIETGGQQPKRANMRSNTLVLGVRIPKDQLQNRIENRVDDMLAAGLEQEARQLAGTYGWECEALKGIGYREWREYLDGAQTLAETRQRVIKATKDLAKRQRTWFKRNPSIQWIDDPSRTVDIVTTFMNK